MRRLSVRRRKHVETCSWNEERNRDTLSGGEEEFLVDGLLANLGVAIVYLQNHMVHQRLAISELHFDKFPTLSNVFIVEDNIQDSRKCLFLGGNVMDQRSGDGRFGGQSQIFALNLWASFPKF